MQVWSRFYVQLRHGPIDLLCQVPPLALMSSRPRVLDRTTRVVFIIRINVVQCTANVRLIQVTVYWVVVMILLALPIHCVSPSLVKVKYISDVDTQRFLRSLQFMEILRYELPYKG